MFETTPTGADPAAPPPTSDTALATNKAVLFALLADAQITAVIVTFDGYGDEGRIETIEVQGATDELPSVDITLLLAQYGQTPTPRTLALADALDQLACDFLAQTHGGWEDGEGAFGDVTFDVAAASITLEFNERYVASNNFTHQF